MLIRLRVVDVVCKVLIIVFLLDCRPNVMQAAQDMQRNNPELFESMQQQAAQFAAGNQQQQQGPNDSSSGSGSSEQNKKQ